MEDFSVLCDYDENVASFLHYRRLIGISKSIN